MTAGGSEAQQPEFLGLAYIALLVMLLIGYVQVPSMTQMIVSVGGVGAMVQGASRGGEPDRAKQTGAGCYTRNGKSRLGSRRSRDARGR